MTASDVAAGGESQHKKSTGRRLAVWTGVVLTLIVLILSIVGIWGARRIRSFLEFGKQAQTDYAALNRAFPFTPPAAGTIGDERWRKMIEVRKRLETRITPELREKIAGLLETRRGGEVAAAQAFLTVEPAIEALIREHLAALREANMSLEEYRWLLGLTLCKTLDAPWTYPAGAQYQDLMNRAVALHEALGNRGRKLDPRQGVAVLDKFYADHRLPIQIDPNALESNDPALHAMDLLCVASQWYNVGFDMKAGLRGILNR